ncbi:MAG: GNAT family N-acetyltransferase [Planctomycetes bacterium]|nr:GNAT family N-acetyltransferase [Planctomycetota bacterium]
MTYEANEIVTAYRRSERSLVEQVSQWESLDYGVAYWSAAHPALAEANQLRDVWLADVAADEAFARAEDFFAQRGARCGKWTAASSQSEGPVLDLMTSKGWQRVETQVMSLARWNLAEVAVDPAIRILPARAMRKAHRATFGESSAEGDAAVDRLNDSNLDEFVAMVDGVAAGRIGYLSVGDTARITNVFVLPAFRGRRVGMQLIAHVLRLAKRLLPKALVTGAESAADQVFLNRCGFDAAGTTVEFRRSE